MEILKQEFNEGDFTYKQIDRTDKAAIYEQHSLGGGHVISHEVFFVKVLPPQEIYGKQYGEREKYPSNEEFGKSAWSIVNREKAMRKFNAIK